MDAVLPSGDADGVTSERLAFLQLAEMRINAWQLGNQRERPPGPGLNGSGPFTDLSADDLSDLGVAKDPVGVG